MPNAQDEFNNIILHLPLIGFSVYLGIKLSLEAMELVDFSYEGSVCNDLIACTSSYIENSDQLNNLPSELRFDLILASAFTIATPLIGILKRYLVTESSFSLFKIIFSFLLLSSLTYAGVFAALTICNGDSVCPNITLLNIDDSATKKNITIVEGLLGGIFLFLALGNFAGSSAAILFSLKRITRQLTKMCSAPEATQNTRNTLPALELAFRQPSAPPLEAMDDPAENSTALQRVVVMR